jgi:hypothetical protein
MIDILGRALPGQLLILPEHGWQPQLLQVMLEKQFGRLAGGGHGVSPDNKLM